MQGITLPEIEYEDHPAYCDLPPMPNDEAIAFRAKYEETLFRVLDKLRPYAANWSNSARSSVEGPWQELGKTGIAANHLSQNMKNKSREIFNIYLGNQINSDEFLDVHRISGNELQQPKNIELLNFIQELIQSTGMLNAISSYLSTNKISISTIHFKRHRRSAVDRDYPFPDRPDIAGPGSGLHIDIVPQVIKLMIYINSVDSVEMGPFRYVKGSHAENRPILDYVIRETTNLFTSKVDAKSRQQLMALPTMYRKKCYFGNDLQDGRPETLHVLSNEATFYSNKGDYFLFDPAGIHRGNDVRSDTPREVIQVSFRGV